jgi:hypothetical protein
MIDRADRGRGREGGPRHAGLVSDSADRRQTRVAPFVRAGRDRGEAILDEAILAVVRSGVERVTGGGS